ncbi:hypothetical protein RYX36_032654 [Vicia faba]
MLDSAPQRLVVLNVFFTLKRKKSREHHDTERRSFMGIHFYPYMNRLRCLLSRGETIFTLVPFLEMFFPLALVLLFPICICYIFKAYIHLQLNLKYLSDST